MSTIKQTLQDINKEIGDVGMEMEQLEAILGSMDASMRKNFLNMVKGAKAFRGSIEDAAKAAKAFNLSNKDVSKILSAITAELGSVGKASAALEKLGISGEYIDKSFVKVKKSVDNLSHSFRRSDQALGGLVDNLGDANLATAGLAHAFKSFREGIAKYNKEIYYASRGVAQFGVEHERLMKALERTAKITGLNTKTTAEMFRVYQGGLAGLNPSLEEFVRLNRIIGKEFGNTSGDIKPVIQQLTKLKTLGINVDVSYLEDMQKGLKSQYDIMSKIREIEILGGSQEDIETLLRFNKATGLTDTQHELKTMDDLLQHIADVMEEFVAKNGEKIRGVIEVTVGLTEKILNIISMIPAPMLKVLASLAVAQIVVKSISSTFLSMKGNVLSIVSMLEKMKDMKIASSIGGFFSRGASTASAAAASVLPRGMAATLGIGGATGTAASSAAAGGGLAAALGPIAIVAAAVVAALAAMVAAFVISKKIFEHSMKQYSEKTQIRMNMAYHSMAVGGDYRMQVGKARGAAVEQAMAARRMSVGSMVASGPVSGLSMGLGGAAGLAAMYVSIKQTSEAMTKYNQITMASSNYQNMYNNAVSRGIEVTDEMSAAFAEQAKQMAEQDYAEIRKAFLGEGFTSEVKEWMYTFESTNLIMEYFNLAIVVASNSMAEFVSGLKEVGQAIGGIGMDMLPDWASKALGDSVKFVSDQLGSVVNPMEEARRMKEDSRKMESEIDLLMGQRASTTMQMYGASDSDRGIYQSEINKIDDRIRRLAEEKAKTDVLLSMGKTRSTALSNADQEEVNRRAAELVNTMTNQDSLAGQMNAKFKDMERILAANLKLTEKMSTAAAGLAENIKMSTDNVGAMLEAYKLAVMYQRDAVQNAKDLYEQERLRVANTSNASKSDVLSVQEKLLQYVSAVSKEYKIQDEMIDAQFHGARKLLEAEINLGEARLSLTKSFLGGIGMTYEAQLEMVDLVRNKQNLVAAEYQTQMQRRQQLEEEVNAARASGDEGRLLAANNALADAKVKLMGLDQERVGLVQKEVELTKELRYGYLSAVEAQAMAAGKFSKILFTQSQGINTMLGIQTDRMKELAGESPGYGAYNAALGGRVGADTVGTLGGEFAQFSTTGFRNSDAFNRRANALGVRMAPSTTNRGEIAGRAGLNSGSTNPRSANMAVTANQADIGVLLSNMGPLGSVIGGMLGVPVANEQEVAAQQATANTASSLNNKIKSELGAEANRVQDVLHTPNQYNRVTRESGGVAIGQINVHVNVNWDKVSTMVGEEVRKALKDLDGDLKQRGNP